MVDEVETEQWSPSQRGRLYSLNARRWQLELDSSEWTLDVLESGTYLDRFSDQEASEDYNYRTRMSSPLDMCRDGVQIRVDNIWRVPPLRTVKDGTKYTDIINGLIADADNSGTRLDTFMRGVTWDYYVNGVDVVTQMTDSDLEVLTKADEEAAGIRPYFLRFGPLDRVDWAADGASNFVWSRYSLGMRQPETEQDGATGIVNYLSVDSTTWKVWEVSKETGQERAIVVREGTHTVGIPPITKAYFSESRKPGQGAVPLSLLTRPSVIAKVLLNLKSQADADLLAAVSRYVLTGVGPDDVPDTYGPGMMLKLTQPDAALHVVQGDVKHITEKRDWVMLYVEEILRLLKFRGGMAEIRSGQGSGVRLAIERTDLDNELRSTAHQLETVEIEMMRQAASMATGESIPKEDASETLGYMVKYNTDYVLEPLEKSLANLKLWLDSGVASDDVPGIGRALLWAVAKQIIPEATEAHEMVKREIDATTFTGFTDLNTEADA